MKKVLLYVHGGSGNHGCEALVRMLSRKFKEIGVTSYALASNIREDEQYGVHKEVNLINLSSHINQMSLSYIKAYVLNRFFKSHVQLDMYPYRKKLKELEDYDVAVAIGGDTYSYSYAASNTYMHDVFIKKGMRTVLWGCSINPELLDDRRVLKDLMRFDYITARESITYNALRDKGIKNIDLLPDVAFGLNRIESLQSKNIKPNTIGLNLSPMIISYHKDVELIYDNFDELVKYIIEETDFNIALIPHVVWHGNDDRKILERIYTSFGKSSRLEFIEDCNCMELKGVIARCRMMICSRTHASIAAYSSKVPTLVLGYSVKSKGIACDVWGEAKSDFVVPVQSFKSKTDLLDAFKEMLSYEDKMKERLEGFMPQYILKLDQKDIFKRVLFGGEGN